MQKSSKQNGVLSSVELAGMEFETLPLTGDYKRLIGIPSRNFSAMVYGMPGSGKTSFCIMFAKYLAEMLTMKVLFATIEEGINHTIQEKVLRLNTVHPNLSIASYMPEDVKALRNLYPNTIFISIFQVTKEGKYKGSQEYEHDVDVVIRAENGTVSTVGCKNRFGAGGEINVF